MRSVICRWMSSDIPGLGLGKPSAMAMFIGAPSVDWVASSA